MCGSSPILLAGTDTGVGKTWVGCALAHALRRRGHRVIAIKPVETGCAGAPMADEDGVRLALATGQGEPGHALVRLRAPVAPAEAAEREQLVLDFDVLVDRVRGLVAKAEIALVEGAGGLLSPITWEHDLTDLGRALEARVLLVASDRLGTINHTRMALRVVAERSLDLTGVVFDAPREVDASTGSNAVALVRLAPNIRVITLPCVPEPASLAAALAPLLGWFGLG
ncbi:MAG: dethiobiotin synthase [Polyangiaceae bacterium]|nr:dethiobiotin synthase [Polyangiaceae bacterium]